MRTLWITAAVIFVLDQVTKVIVVHWLNLKELGSLDVLPPFVNFRMAWNRGINFGLFSGDSDWARWVLIAIALVIAGWVVWWLHREAEGWLIWWLHREDEGWWAYLSGGLLVGGAVGNVIDRILYGAVADFLNMSCCGFENPWSFNVADISIFAGAFGLILFTGRDKGRDAPRKTR
jgi:signal peptidase II